MNGLLEILRPKLWWKCGGIIRSRWGMHCEVYTGPESIGSGVKAAIKEKFTDIENVLLTL